MEVKEPFQTLFFSFCLNGMVTVKRRSPRFEAVQSVLTPDQPFVHSIVSFLARKALHIEFATSPFVIARLSFRVHAQAYSGTKGNGENYVNGTEWLTPFW